MLVSMFRASRRLSRISSACSSSFLATTHTAASSYFGSGSSGNSSNSSLAASSLTLPSQHHRSFFCHPTALLLAPKKKKSATLSSSSKKEDKKKKKGQQLSASTKQKGSSGKKKSVPPMKKKGSGGGKKVKKSSTTEKKNAKEKKTRSKSAAAGDTSVGGRTSLLSFLQTHAASLSKKKDEKDVEPQTKTTSCGDGSTKKDATSSGEQEEGTITKTTPKLTGFTQTRNQDATIITTAADLNSPFKKRPNLQGRWGLFREETSVKELPGSVGGSGSRWERLMQRSARGDQPPVMIANDHMIKTATGSGDETGPRTQASESMLRHWKKGSPGENIRRSYFDAGGAGGREPRSNTTGGVVPHGGGGNHGNNKTPHFQNKHGGSGGNKFFTEEQIARHLPRTAIPYNADLPLRMDPTPQTRYGTIIYTDFTDFPYHDYVYILADASDTSTSTSSAASTSSSASLGLGSGSAAAAPAPTNGNSGGGKPRVYSCTGREFRLKRNIPMGPRFHGDPLFRNKDHVPVGLRVAFEVAEEEFGGNDENGEGKEEEQKSDFKANGAVTDSAVAPEVAEEEEEMEVGGLFQDVVDTAGHQVENGKSLAAQEGKDVKKQHEKEGANPTEDNMATTTSATTTAADMLHKVKKQRGGGYHVKAMALRLASGEFLVPLGGNKGGEAVYNANIAASKNKNKDKDNHQSNLDAAAEQDADVAAAVIVTVPEALQKLKPRDRVPVEEIPVDWPTKSAAVGGTGGGRRFRTLSRGSGSASSASAEAAAAEKTTTAAAAATSADAAAGAVTTTESSVETMTTPPTPAIAAAAAAAAAEAARTETTTTTEAAEAEAGSKDSVAAAVDDPNTSSSSFHTTDQPQYSSPSPPSASSSPTPSSSSVAASAAPAAYDYQDEFDYYNTFGASTLLHGGAEGIRLAKLRTSAVPRFTKKTTTTTNNNNQEQQGEASTTSSATTSSSTTAAGGSAGANVNVNADAFIEAHKNYEVFMQQNEPFQRYQHLMQKQQQEQEQETDEATQKQGGDDDADDVGGTEDGDGSSVAATSSSPLPPNVEILTCTIIFIRSDAITVEVTGGSGSTGGTGGTKGGTSASVGGTGATGGNSYSEHVGTKIKVRAKSIWPDGQYFPRQSLWVGMKIKVPVMETTVLVRNTASSSHFAGGGNRSSASVALVAGGSKRGAGGGGGHGMGMKLNQLSGLLNNKKSNNTGSSSSNGGHAPLRPVKKLRVAGLVTKLSGAPFTAPVIGGSAGAGAGGALSGSAASASSSTSPAKAAANNSTCNDPAQWLELLRPGERLKVSPSSANSKAEMFKEGEEEPGEEDQQQLATTGVGKTSSAAAAALGSSAGAIEEGASDDGEVEVAAHGTTTHMLKKNKGYRRFSGSIQKVNYKKNTVLIRCDYDGGSILQAKDHHIHFRLGRWQFFDGCLKEGQRVVFSIGRSEIREIKELRAMDVRMEDTEKIKRNFFIEPNAAEVESKSQAAANKLDGNSDGINEDNMKKTSDAAATTTVAPGDGAAAPTSTQKVTEATASSSVATTDAAAFGAALPPAGFTSREQSSNGGFDGGFSRKLDNRSHDVVAHDEEDGSGFSGIPFGKPNYNDYRDTPVTRGAVVAVEPTRGFAVIRQLDTNVEHKTPIGRFKFVDDVIKPHLLTVGEQVSYYLRFNGTFLWPCNVMSICETTGAKKRIGSVVDTYDWGAGTTATGAGAAGLGSSKSETAASSSSSASATAKPTDSSTIPATNVSFSSGERQVRKGTIKIINVVQKFMVILDDRDVQPRIARFQDVEVGGDDGEGDGGSGGKGGSEHGEEEAETNSKKTSSSFPSNQSSSSSSSNKALCSLVIGKRVEYRVVRRQKSGKEECVAVREIGGAPIGGGGGGGGDTVTTTASVNA